MMPQYSNATLSTSKRGELTAFPSLVPLAYDVSSTGAQRADHDYALSYIRREGKGRVFVEVLGHDESIYKIPSMLAHILAGVQYALGDLQADDSPTNPAKP